MLSDHGDNADDEIDVDVSTDESTEMMPPLPPVSWFKKTEVYCGKFRKPYNKDHRDEEQPFFDCQDQTREQLDILQQVDPWMRNAPKSVPFVKSCSSVNLPPVPCVRSWVCTNACQSRHHSLTVKQRSSSNIEETMSSGPLCEAKICL